MAYYVLYNPLAGACKGEGISDRIIDAVKTAFGVEPNEILDVTAIDYPAFFADKTENDCIIIYYCNLESAWYFVSSHPLFCGPEVQGRGGPSY